MNNMTWIMSSALPALSLEEVMRETVELGYQGIEVCVFRLDGTRKDHVAAHLDAEGFSPESARRIIHDFNQSGLKLSLGFYDNLIGGPEGERLKNQNHLLKVIRMAALLGGDANEVKVGTFVGYNHELGGQDGGFQKNLELYGKVFAPILRYAEDSGVTLLYENCPMEGWRPATATGTYNNLPATLAARKLMYALIPSRAHGETYDPSHDVWQHTDPVEVIKVTDMKRLQRIHVKSTRNLSTAARVHWGGLYPMQAVDLEPAKKAGVPTCAHEWDRHHYEPMIPGFGGSDSMDWRQFIECLKARGYRGPYVVENEAANSKGTGDLGAIRQGFKAGLLFLAPMIWPLSRGAGYRFDPSAHTPLKDFPGRDVPLLTMEQLA